MLSLIPEDPTPAQKRLIESDWFASALEKMPEGSDISFALWSQATWKAVRQMPSVKVSPEAQWLNLIDKILDDDTHAHNDDAKALSKTWNATIRDCIRALLPSTIYHAKHISILKALITTIELLHPDDPRFLINYNGVMNYYDNGSDDALIKDLFESARQEIHDASPHIQELRERIEQAKDLDNATRASIEAVIDTITEGRPRHVQIHHIYQRINHVDPVTCLAICYELALAPTRDLIKSDEHGSGWMRSHWSPKNLLWHIAVNLHRSQPAVTQTYNHLLHMLFYLLSISPVRFKPHKRDFYIFHLSDEHIDEHAFSEGAALFTQAEQFALANDLFCKTIYKPLDQELAARAISPTRGMLYLWCFASKTYRQDRFEAHLEKHTSKEDLLAVTLDVLACKMTATRQKTLVELFEKLEPSFDLTQQHALATGAARVLKGKTLKTIQKYTPEVDWPKVLAEHAPKKSAAPKKKTPKTKPNKEPVHVTLQGIKPKKLPKLVDASLAQSLTWHDEKRAVNATEFALLITALRESGPHSAHHPDIEAICKQLEAKTLDALGFALLRTWESSDSPAAHKWMLFQLRHTGKPANVTKLGRAHNWESWASSGKWARACWYLELVSDMGPSKASDKLFIGLLDAGKVDSTLQMTARSMFPKFARALGYKDVHKYLMERGLLGHVPAPKALSFKPGVSSLTIDGESLLIVVEQAQLKLQRQRDHHTLAITDEHLAHDPKLVHYIDEVENHAMQWSAYYERQHRLKESVPLSKAKKALAQHGPVHQSIFCSLLWRARTQGTVCRFDPEGTCFDVNYDPVELSGDDVLELVSFEALKGKQKSAWMEHLTESEVILPFDPFASGHYFARVTALSRAPFDGTRTDTSGVVWALSNQGYHKAHVLDNGIVWEHYKTLPHYNVRIFVEHTGVDVSNDCPCETPGKITGLRFTDLLGKTVSGAKVEPGALSTLYDDLATFLTA